MADRRLTIGELRLRLMLWAQRRARLVPAPVRWAASRILPGVRGRTVVATPPPDWSVPLVPGGDEAGFGALPMPMPPVSSTQDSHGGASGAAVTVADRVVRALVAVNVLDVGGMDEFVAFLGRGLPRHGVHTVVGYADTHEAGQVGEGGRLVRVLENEGVPTVRLTPEGAAARLNELRPHVVSAHGAPSWLLDAASDAGVAWVETLHGPHHFLHPQSWPAERERATRIAAQVAVSDMVRRRYLARMPTFSPRRLVTIPNGVDVTRLAEVDRLLGPDRAAARAALGLTDEFVFVSLSRYVLQKNVYALVTAFADVAAEHPNAHLVVAGRADDALYFEHCRRHAVSLPCADRIHLRGHCPNPSALLAAADAFVLDSFFEGWSLSTMEAMACGLPVVVTDVGGAREQLSAWASAALAGVPAESAGTGEPVMPTGPALPAVPRGHLVPNPVGDPELLDWRVMSDLRFHPQGNQAELAAAMSAVVARRSVWAARRSELARQARAAFPPELCLSRHAALLRAVAAGHAVPHFLPTDGFAPPPPRPLAAIMTSGS